MIWAPRLTRISKTSVSRLLCSLLLAMTGVAPALAQTEKDAEWARVIEDDRAIKIETDKLEAVISKKNPKQWMTGIEKGTFLDKATGFREIGDGLMVIDWLMEAGSDEAWSDKVIARTGTASAGIPGTRTRRTRPGNTTPSWPTAAATASAWSRDPSFATA